MVRGIGVSGTDALSLGDLARLFQLTFRNAPVYGVNYASRTTEATMRAFIVAVSLALPAGCSSKPGDSNKIEDEKAGKVESLAERMEREEEDSARRRADLIAQCLTSY